MAKKLEITLVRSPINRPETQKLTVRGLGLRKLHQTVVREVANCTNSKPQMATARSASASAVAPAPALARPRVAV